MSVGSKCVKVHGGGVVAMGVPPSQGGGPIPSYPIPDLVPTASPTEAGPNPPWPWGAAPQHLGTPHSEPRQCLPGLALLQLPHKLPGKHCGVPKTGTLCMALL